MTSASCCSTPRIVVNNLSNGELVPHSVLIVKGRVEQTCTEHSSISLNINGQTDEFTEPLSLRGEFKFLVELREEQKYLLLLRHCKASYTLELEVAYDRKPYRLQPLLIVCQDQHEQREGEFEGLCEKIDVNLRVVQAVYAEKLRESGFGRVTFAIRRACHVFRSQLKLTEAWRLDEHALWQCIAAELISSPDYGNDDKLKFVAFIGCTKYEAAVVAATGDYSYANIRRHLKAHAALGGGGLALFGSAYFYAWPQKFGEILPSFRNQTAVDLKRLPDESNYRRTYAGVYATTLGAICHELGHSFDLGHSNDGVMGDGFDYLNRVFTLDAKTEHLPARVIATSSSAVATGAQKRLTQLKKPGSGRFLDKYHEQKQNDSFYFSRNCSLILAHHKWLRSDPALGDNHEEVVVLNLELCTVESKGQPLIIVEVRRQENSLVDEFYDLSKQPLSRFEVPAKIRPLLFDKRTHYLFAMTVDGCTKRLLN